MNSTKGIFCLEGLWENDLKKPSSVLPLLLFLKQNAEIPYIYRDCATPEELDFYLKKFTLSKYKDYPILYLAFHGEQERLTLPGKSDYSLEKLGEKLKDQCKGKIIFLGSCSVLDVHKSKIKQLLKDTGALAILGYKNDVNWLRSSAFEMLILSELQENVFTGKGIDALVKKCSQIAKSFKHSEKGKDIEFRMVSKKEL